MGRVTLPYLASVRRFNLGRLEGFRTGRSLLAGFLSIKFLLGVLPWRAHSSHYHRQQQHRENSEEDQSPGYVFTVAWDSLRARSLNGGRAEREPELSACNSLSRQCGTCQEFVPPPCLLLCFFAVHQVKHCSRFLDSYGYLCGLISGTSMSPLVNRKGLAPAAGKAGAVGQNPPLLGDQGEGLPCHCDAPANCECA